MSCWGLFYPHLSKIVVFSLDRDNPFYGKVQMLHCLGSLFFGLVFCFQLAPFPSVSPTYVYEALLAISICTTFAKTFIGTGGRISSFAQSSNPQRKYHVFKEIAESNI